MRQRDEDPLLRPVGTAAPPPAAPPIPAVRPSPHMVVTHLIENPDDSGQAWKREQNVGSGTRSGVRFGGVHNGSKRRSKGRHALC
jgi:hypothetical protein